MPRTAQNTAIATLLALGSVASTAHAGGNPWNPFPVTSQAAQAAPIAQPVAPQSAPMVQPAAPSRFAPAGLEQQLAAAPLAQYAPSPEAEPQTNARMAPPRYAPKNGANGTAYAPQGYTNAPQGYANGSYAPGYPQGYNQRMGYGGYPQQGFAPYNNQGFNNNTSNGPFGPFGVPSIPGGFGTSFPIPGNITNGGVPGFNMSPFGLF